MTDRIEQITSLAAERQPGLRWRDMATEQPEDWGYALFAIDGVPAFGEWHSELGHCMTNSGYQKPSHWLPLPELNTPKA